MKRNFSFAIFSTGILFVLLIISCTFIKFDFKSPCNIHSENNEFTIYINKKIHKFINSNNVKKINAEIDDAKYMFFIYYKHKNENFYEYWLTPTEYSFTLEEGSFNFYFNFGKINFISYLF